MKVRMLHDDVLGYGPQHVHAGQVLELPDGFAQALIARGSAAPAEDDARPGVDPQRMNMAQLRSYAAELGLDVPARIKRAELVKMVQEALEG